MGVLIVYSVIKKYLKAVHIYLHPTLEKRKGKKNLYRKKIRVSTFNPIWQKKKINLLDKVLVKKKLKKYIYNIGKKSAGILGIVP